jgi:glycosyltransferase involved in cell wall biosynthesis
MDQRSKVTVIITTYNRAHLLPRAIMSVLNQTYQNFELIIVDDALTDNTEEVVESFTEKQKQKLLKRGHEKCREDMKVNIQFMDKIPITESGKFRFVISKVSPFVK